MPNEEEAKAAINASTTVRLKGRPIKSWKPACEDRPYKASLGGGVVASSPGGGGGDTAAVGVRNSRLRRCGVAADTGWRRKKRG